MEQKLMNLRNENKRVYNSQVNIPNEYKQPVIDAIKAIQKTTMTEENSKVLYVVYNKYVASYNKKDYRRNPKCRQKVKWAMSEIVQYWEKEKKILDESKG